MGYEWSLDIPAHGRLTVRDGVEVHSRDAPGGTFHDAITFQFERSPSAPVGGQIHFLQFVAEEFRVHCERGGFSAHGTTADGRQLTDHADRPAWWVDTRAPSGLGDAAIANRPWYDAGAHHSVVGATLTMADRPGFPLPDGMGSAVASVLAEPANQAELARHGQPTAVHFIQHFDTYAVQVGPHGIDVLGHVRWQANTPLDHLGHGVGHGTDASPVHTIQPPERAHAVSHDQWTALRDDPRPLHDYANALPHGAVGQHDHTAPSHSHIEHPVTPHRALEGFAMSQDPHRLPGTDFHAPNPLPHRESLPGADFGAPHTDFLKHPVGEIGHDVHLPGQEPHVLHGFDKGLADLGGGQHSQPGQYPQPGHHTQHGHHTGTGPVHTDQPSGGTGAPPLQPAPSPVQATPPAPPAPTAAPQDAGTGSKYDPAQFGIHTDTSTGSMPMNTSNNPAPPLQSQPANKTLPAAGDSAPSTPGTDFGVPHSHDHPTPAPPHLDPGPAHDGGPAGDGGIGHAAEIAPPPGS